MIRRSPLRNFHLAVPVVIAIAPPRVVGVLPEPRRVRRVRGRLLTVPAPPGVGPPRHPERSLGTVEEVACIFSLCSAKRKVA